LKSFACRRGGHAREKKKRKREENSLATLLITLVSLGGFVLI